MCNDCREVAVKHCRCLLYFDSCLLLLLPYEDHVLRDDSIASDLVARPQCIIPVVCYLQVSFVSHGELGNVVRPQGVVCVS